MLLDEPEEEELTGGNKRRPATADSAVSAKLPLPTRPPPSTTVKIASEISTEVGRCSEEPAEAAEPRPPPPTAAKLLMYTSTAAARLVAELFGKWWDK